MCRWTVNCVIQHNVVRPHNFQLVEAVLHIQLGVKSSVKMKFYDPMYCGKARINGRRLRYTLGSVQNAVLKLNHYKNKAEVP